METIKGPKVQISFSCSNCEFCKSTYYNVQGDTGHDVYCDHPSFDAIKRIGDTRWDTPDFCPYKIDALKGKIKSLDI